MKYVAFYLGFVVAFSVLGVLSDRKEEEVAEESPELFI